MKYLNKYESFDFNEDDFDFEEEPEKEFDIGDNVKLVNSTEYWYGDIDRDYHWVKYGIDRKFNRQIINIKHSSDIKPIPTNYEGYMIFTSGTADKLWWKIEDFELDENFKNESFDFNVDDFDFEEDENSDIEVGDRVILKDTIYYRSEKARIEYKNLPYEKIKLEIQTGYINQGRKVIKIDTKDDGEPIMQIGNNWPWYEIKYWKKKN